MLKYFEKKVDYNSIYDTMNVNKYGETTLGQRVADHAAVLMRLAGVLVVLRSCLGVMTCWGTGLAIRRRAPTL
jgi:hypothetical protein